MFAVAIFFGLYFFALLFLVPHPLMHAFFIFQLHFIMPASFFSLSGVGLLSLAAGAFAAKKWPTLAK
jgi:hypothetical protein